MIDIPYVPTLADWSIIISGIVILGGGLIAALCYLIVKLVRFVGWKYVIGWFAGTAFIVLGVVTIFGR